MILDVENFTGVPAPGATHTVYNAAWAGRCLLHRRAGQGPDGRKGADWSVCTVSGGEPDGGGVVEPPAPVVPEVPLALLLPLDAAAVTRVIFTRRHRAPA